VAKITKDCQYVNIEISNDFDKEGVSQKNINTSQKILANEKNPYICIQIKI